MQMALIANKQVALDNLALRQVLLWAILIFLMLSLVQTARGSLLAAETHHGWVIGDWLINYQGGFVRRGLIGEGIFRLSAVLGINPDRLVILVHIMCYTVFFGFAFLLLRQQKVLWRYFPLIISPAIFLFQIYDPQGGYRKEILFIAVLAFLVWAAKSLSEQTFVRWFYAVLLAYPAFVLSHEVLIIWLPILLIVYTGTVPFTRKRLLILGTLCALSVLALMASLVFRGEPNTAAAIAFSLRGAGYMNLNAAIAALAASPAQGLEMTKSFIAKGDYWVNYPQTLVLASLAFIPVRTRLVALFTPKSAALFLVSLVGTALVMTVAADWGRFLYVLVISLFLLSFLTEEKPAPFNPAPGLFLLIMISLFAYASLWHFPHSDKANPYNSGFFAP